MFGTLLLYLFLCLTRCQSLRRLFGHENGNLQGQQRGHDGDRIKREAKGQVEISRGALPGSTVGAPAGRLLIGNDGQKSWTVVIVVVVMLLLLLLLFPSRQSSLHHTRGVLGQFVLFVPRRDWLLVSLPTRHKRPERGQRAMQGRRWIHVGRRRWVVVVQTLSQERHDAGRIVLLNCRRRGPTRHQDQSKGFRPGAGRFFLERSDHVHVVRDKGRGRSVGNDRHHKLLRVFERPNGGIQLVAPDQQVVRIVRGNGKNGNLGLGQRRRETSHNARQTKVQRSFHLQADPIVFDFQIIIILAVVLLLLMIVVGYPVLRANNGQFLGGSGDGAKEGRRCAIIADVAAMMIGPRRNGSSSR
mmetsp:Transcript_2349/g.5832  ORF Transcript_2349/g.5832 Transcript_2349/m.5832 type:complete len:357 (-) Transcript_2349:134-1204(-)